MTRLATLMLALALAFGLSGCGGDDAPADDTPSAEATDAAADDTSGDDAPSAPPVFTN